jgi:hypothetical protein
MDERKSTISKSVLPVGQSTRDLLDELRLRMYGSDHAAIDGAIGLLAEADARDPFAVSNLLYAWRTGQLT